MIKKFRDIFTGLEERFGYHIVENQNSNSTKKSGISRTSDYGHDDSMWQAHLDGKKFNVKTKNGDIQADSLGICPINRESNMFLQC